MKYCKECKCFIDEEKHTPEICIVAQIHEEGGSLEEMRRMLDNQPLRGDTISISVQDWDDIIKWVESDPLKNK